MKSTLRRVFSRRSSDSSASSDGCSMAKEAVFEQEMNRILT